MFGLLKKKNLYEQDAYDVYERIMQHIREPELYTKFNIPDTFDGRFELLLAHAFMVIEILHEKDSAAATDFNQALFDRIFIQMKITLREIGVGDVGIPKHMQKMMKAFNGRMHNYADALDADMLKTALLRNLYGTVMEPPVEDVEAFADYMKANIEVLRAQDFAAIIDNEQLFELAI